MNRRVFFSLHFYFKIPPPFCVKFDVSAEFPGQLAPLWAMAMNIYCLMTSFEHAERVYKQLIDYNKHPQQNFVRIM